MLIKLDNPKILTDAISIISELVTEVKLKVNKEGLSIVAIDPANVALVAFNLPASAFSAFEADNEAIGVSLESFKSVLKRCSQGSSIIMQTDENGLRVEIHDKIKRTFNLALIDIETEDKQVPELEFSSFVNMKSGDIAQAVEDCSVVADTCSFSIKDGKFIIEARGLHSTKSEFSADEVALGGSEARAKYSLGYLQKFVKACKLAEQCKVYFSNDYPMKLELKESNFGMSFVLAPRMETED